MNVKVLLIFFMIFISYNCKYKKSNATESVNLKKDTLKCMDYSSVKEQKPILRDCINPNYFIGFLTLSDNYVKPRDTISILNNDGSIWHAFTFYYDDSDGNYEFKNLEFRPFAFHPDYFLIALSVLKKNGHVYDIIANHKTGLIKKVNNTDKKFKFYSTEEYLVQNIFSVGFDREKNPVTKNYDSNKNMVVPPEIFEFHPIEIKDYSIKIKWLEKENWKTGWIKWRDDECFVIEIFHFA